MKQNFFLSCESMIFFFDARNEWMEWDMGTWKRSFQRLKAQKHTKKKNLRLLVESVYEAAVNGAVGGMRAASLCVRQGRTKIDLWIQIEFIFIAASSSGYFSKWNFIWNKMNRKVFSFHSPRPTLSTNSSKEHKRLHSKCKFCYVCLHRYPCKPQLAVKLCVGFLLSRNKYFYIPDYTFTLIINSINIFHTFYHLGAVSCNAELSLAARPRPAKKIFSTPEF